MSVKPSARRSSSATYWGAMQMPAIFASRTVVVSSNPSWAGKLRAPIRPAAPADDSVVRKRRRFCVMRMMPHLSPSDAACERSRLLPLQLALELVEEPPVSALRDDLAGRRLDYARFVQSQRVEPDRVLGIVVAPSARTEFPSSSVESNRNDSLCAQPTGQHAPARPHRNSPPSRLPAAPAW